MSQENRARLSPPRFPRSTTSGPNLATLDQLRSLRRPRLVPAPARRRLATRECVSC